MISRTISVATVIHAFHHILTQIIGIKIAYFKGNVNCAFAVILDLGPHLFW